MIAGFDGALYELLTEIGAGEEVFGSKLPGVFVIVFFGAAYPDFFRFC